MLPGRACPCCLLRPRSVACLWKHTSSEHGASGVFWALFGATQPQVNKIMLPHWPGVHGSPSCQHTAGMHPYQPDAQCSLLQWWKPTSSTTVSEYCCLCSTSCASDPAQRGLAVRGVLVLRAAVSRSRQQSLCMLQCVHLQHMTPSAAGCWLQQLCCNAGVGRLTFGLQVCFCIALIVFHPANSSIPCLHVIGILLGRWRGCPTDTSITVLHLLGCQW